ncbi:MAG: hypothetical protein A7316_06335 [Candidatus Altiarchaeales archaeon WOR_SM1_86-2]|nr:MAG: hypothetical protein A7316_06335 [Candidatus Altiarchaeales archaeon WOR_SM1_86-2]
MEDINIGRMLKSRSTIPMLIGVLFIGMQSSSACMVQGFTLNETNDGVAAHVEGYCPGNDQYSEFWSGPDGAFGLIFGTPFQACDSLCGNYIPINAANQTMHIYGGHTVNAGDYPGHATISGQNITMFEYLAKEGNLTITKTADKAFISESDAINFTLTINNGTGTANNITVVDVLPEPLVYMPGTAEVNGTPQEPLINGRNLTWENIVIDSNQSVDISFICIVNQTETAYISLQEAFARGLADIRQVESGSMHGGIAGEITITNYGDVPVRVDPGVILAEEAIFVGVISTQEGVTQEGTIPGNYTNETITNDALVLLNGEIYNSTIHNITIVHYTHGGVPIVPAGESITLTQADGWFCIEKGQVIQTNSKLIVSGEILPEPLASILANTSITGTQRQNALQNYQDAHGVLTVSKRPLYSLMDPQTNIDIMMNLTVFNRGYKDVYNVTLIDIIPLGYTATDYSLAPESITPQDDGTQIVVWNLSNILGSTVSGSVTNWTRKSVAYMLTTPKLPENIKVKIQGAEVRGVESGDMSNISAVSMMPIIRTKIIKPDLTLSSNDITFSNNDPEVGNQVTITADIRNVGTGNTSNVVVRFYDGDPDDSGTEIGNKTINLILSEETETLEVNWTASSGIHSIYVKADPDDTIEEFDDSIMDNKASKAIYVNSSWWNISWAYRIPVSINAENYLRNDTPIEISLNFTELIQIGFNGTFDENSVRVIEYDVSGNVLNEIDSQFDRSSGYNASTNAYGAVIWGINGTTSQDADRYYYIYFDILENEPKDAPSYTNIIVNDNVLWAGTSNWIGIDDELNFLVRKSIGANINNVTVDSKSGGYTTAQGYGDDFGIMSPYLNNDGWGSFTTSMPEQKPVKIVIKQEGGIRHSYITYYARQKYIKMEMHDGATWTNFAWSIQGVVELGDNPVGHVCNNGMDAMLSGPNGSVIWSVDEPGSWYWAYMDAGGGWYDNPGYNPNNISHLTLNWIYVFDKENLTKLEAKEILNEIKNPPTIYEGTPETLITTTNFSNSTLDADATVIHSKPLTVTITDVTPPTNYSHGYGPNSTDIQRFVDYVANDTFISATIRMYYNEGELLGMGINESTLGMYYWDNTTNNWTMCNNTGVNVDENYVWAIVDHFTIFTAIGQIIPTEYKIKLINTRVDNLREEITMSNISDGLKNILISKLNSSEDKIEQGWILYLNGKEEQTKNMFNTADNILNALQNELYANQGKKISGEDYESWNNQIAIIREALQYIIAND